MQKIIDLTGQKYNKLTVIKLYGQNYTGMAEWLCECDCGNKTIVLSNHLRRGNTKSCGCLRSKSASKLCEERNVSGENSPGYIDGRTKAILELKEEIRKRDNYICQDCGITQEEHKKKYNKILDVHHIDENDSNNTKTNMITLCRGCHNSMRGNHGKNDRPHER